MNRQRGATLVEFVLMAGLLLVPAFLLTPVLGKMTAGKHRYEQGLRYAAWERTAWHETRPRYVSTPAVKTANDLASEVQSRVYGRRGTVLRADDRVRTRDSERPQDYILHRPVLVSLDAQQAGYRPWMPNAVNDQQRPVYATANQSRSRLSGTASAAQQAALDLLSLTSFRVETASVYATRLSTDLEDVNRYKEFRVNNDMSAAPLDLRIDRENGRPRQLLLLADGWGAARREHVAGQVRSLLPTELLNNPGIDSALQIMSWLFIAQELDDLEFGKVDTEVTPAHRLGTYR